MSCGAEYLPAHGGKVNGRRYVVGNQGRLQGSFDHATKPDRRPRTKLGIELTMHQQLRHEAAEVRDDRLPDRPRIGPEDGRRLVCIVRVVPRGRCKGCRESLDHGSGGRLIVHHAEPARSGVAA